MRHASALPLLLALAFPAAAQTTVSATHGDSTGRVYTHLHDGEGGVYGEVWAFLELWLDATDSSTITIGSSPDVQAWLSKDADGRSFEQDDNTDYRPHDGATINSLNAITWDGSDDTLRLTPVPEEPFNDHEAGSVFAVAAMAASFEASPSDHVLGSRDSDDSTADIVHFRSRQDSSGVMRLVVLDDPTPPTNAIEGSTTIGTSTTYLYEWTSTGSDYVLVLNGATETETVSNGSDDGAWFADVPGRGTGGNALMIGSDGTSGDPSGAGIRVLDGSLGELFYFGRTAASAVPAEQRSRIESYLAARWGITLP